MTAREWVAGGTTLFLDAVAGLADTELDRPSGLVGWSRRHLVAHVHFNAEALRRLVAWAKTGVRTPMYADREQRAAEIESGAEWPVPLLRERVRASATALADDLDSMSPAAWQAEVVTAQGRTVPATEILWLRAREVFVHTVDLGAGLTFRDLPADFLDALVQDVVRKRIAAGEAAMLGAWLTGRDKEVPTLGPWL